MLRSYCSMDSFNQRSQVEVISGRINSEDCYFPAYQSQQFSVAVADRLQISSLFKFNLQISNQFAN